jgi:hypothetical protein
MTAIELHIDRLVLRDVPPEYAEGFADAVRERLVDLGRGDVREAVEPRRRPLEGGAALADRVARDVWAAVRPALPTASPSSHGGAS